MTLKKKIEELEKQVAELKFKISLLEARPMIITVSPQPVPVVNPAQQPWAPTYPYVGDPMRPTITSGQLSCGRDFQSGQNRMT